MKPIVASILVALISPASAFASTSTPGFLEEGRQVIEHGGGCRKSSPPGQCCHMDRKKGTVHCH